MSIDNLKNNNEYKINEIFIYKNFKNIIFKISNNSGNNYSVAFGYKNGEINWKLIEEISNFDDKLRKSGEINDDTISEVEKNKIIEKLDLIKLFEKIINESNNEEIIKIISQISGEINLILK